MTGRGSRMSPKERYLRSVYLVYQVCTDVVRHYFDVKFPTERLVQDLLQKRPEFEKKEKKIPNYQWIQLYPEALFRADINIAEKYIEPCDKTAYKEFAHRMKTIFQYIFDTVDGEQKVNLVKTSSFGPGEILSLFEISSRYNRDGSEIRKALEQLVNGGNVDASLEISGSPDGFSMDKQEDVYIMVINLTKEYDAALGQTDSQEFKVMAKRIERILHFLYDSVPGTQLFKVEEFRSLPSTNCISAKCKLTSADLKNEKKLRDTIKRPISERRLGKTLTTICSPNGFSFKDVIVFESEIKVDEKFSKNLANSDHPDFKAFEDRVQPIIKGLYDSSNGEQDVEIVRCRRDERPDTMFVVFHLISHGNNDEEELRKVAEREIRTGSLSLSYGIIADGFRFEPNKCMFNVKVKLEETNEDYKLLANPTSKTFKSFKKKVEPEILRLYDKIDGVQEIDIDQYKIESTGADHFIIFKLTSRDCSDESKLKEPIETQIKTGLLGSILKVSTSDMVFQKLAEKVIYQVSLNVEVQFPEKLKTKHSAEFMAFSKFVQTVLNTHYEHDEKVPGMQEIHVVECRQGPTVTSTNVILEIISHGCTNKEVVRQSIKNLIAVGKLELTLKTSATDFTFKIVRGSKPVSSINFDLSLLITLLRNDSNVEPPETGRYDDLPSKDDKTDGAQIATIKHYRNDLAHASEAKIDEHKFDCLWSNLKNAVRILGKDDKFNKAVDDASTMNLDSSTEEVLIRMVQHDRQVLQLEKDVTELYQSIEKLTKQTEEQSTRTQVEISEIKEEIRKKEEQILKNKTDIQTFHIEIHRVEQKFDEKFRVQDERNVQQDGKNKDMGSGIQENRRGIEENRRDIQRIDTKSAVGCPASSVHSTKQLCTDGGQRSDSSIISIPNITSSSSQKTEFIKRYYDKLPKEYKVGYYDVMILYSSEDRSGAQKFCDHLNRDIYPKEQGKIKAVLYDGPEFEGISLSKFEHFDKGFERCTFTFLYLTKQFVECDWSKFVAQTCLMEAICNPDKQWCFVPVYTVQKADFKIPSYIKPLKEINYYNPDKFYKKCVKRLIGDKIYQRKENDKIQEEKCFQFLVKKVGEDKANEQRLLNEHEDQQQKLEMRSLNSNRE